METSPSDDAKRLDPGEPDEDAQTKVQRLQSRAGRGLWALVAFAAISIWARSGFQYLPPLPPEWQDVMGRPPPPSWISAAFILYVFSALVLSLMKMAGEGSAATGLQHVGYLSAFYGFYFVSGALEDNYWAVLAGGFAILMLECYRNWLYYRHLIREESAKGEGRRR